VETKGSHGSAKSQPPAHELQLEPSDVVPAQERPKNSKAAATQYEPLDRTTPVARRAIRLEAQAAVGVGGIWTHGGRRPLDGLPRSSLCRATRGGVTDFLQVRDQVQAIARFGHTVICHRRAGDHLQRTCQKVVHLPFGPDDPRALHRRRVVEPRNAAGCRLARSCCRLGISNHARYPTVNMGLRPSHAMRGDRNAFGECRGAHARIDARLFEAGFFFSFRQANQPI
jgi:hypothetical protein